jgi:flagellar biosynthesis/type III secretory pathway protein FliH
MSGSFGDECFDRRYLEDEVQKAFLRGLKQGRSEGYDNGFDQGDFQGFNHGRKQGYNDGFNDGENRGYENGYAKGYDKCKEIFDGKVQQAFENGNQDGYEKGFQAGHDKCEEEFNGSYYILLTTTVTRAKTSAIMKMLSAGEFILANLNLILHLQGQIVVRSLYSPITKANQISSRVFKAYPLQGARVTSPRPQMLTDVTRSTMTQDISMVTTWLMRIFSAFYKTNG